ncbi:MAG TPA: hypothetical protein VFS40_01105 [Gemmatimonadales bacterium]|nr:hypothetical protein [Gemmatimonadales bacterium]
MSGRVLTAAATLALAGLGSVLAGCGGATSGGAESPAPASGQAAGAAAAPGVTTSNTGRGSAFLYHAVPATRYAVQRHDSVAFQLPGGQSSSQLLDRTMYFTLALTDGQPGDSGYRVAIALDSIRSGATGLAAQVFQMAEGTHWTAALSRTGKLSGLTADKTNEAVAQIGSTLATYFFPALPAGGAKAEAQWTRRDTTQVQAASFSLQEATTGTYVASAAPETAGRKTLRITADVAVAQTGTGQMSGQPVQVQGSGNRHQEHLLDVDGRLLQATGRDSVAMTYTVPAMGQSVPAVQVGSFTLTPVGVPGR